MVDSENNTKGHLMRSVPIVLFSLLLITASGCSNNYWLLKKIPTEYRDSFRKIKFLITKQERKKFLNLSTDVEREEFFKQFWAKRDPDPETIENEFMDEYLSRIKMADHLFTHEGRTGWETDRGRVYIMLGPPEFKESYPMGYSMYSLPSEVWYYGNFPVIFVDRNRSGSYDLTSLGARHLSLLLAGAQLLKPGVIRKKEFYNFNCRIEKIANNDIHIILSLKNKNIYFKSGADFFYSDVEITLNFDYLGSEDSFSLKRKRRIKIEKSNIKDPAAISELIIPLNLRKGRYELVIIMENHENNIKVQKLIKLKI